MLIRDLYTEAQVAFPEEAYDLISSYVEHGAIQKPGEFDTQFDRLMQLLPRPRQGQTLYRVLRLGAEQIEQIESGGLMLENRRYASWTNTRASLDRLIYDRQKGVGGESVVVIKADIPAQNIVVDVAAFYKKYHLNNNEFTEWDRYVRPEREVIVRQDAPLRVTPTMVVEIISSDRDVSVAPPRAGQAFIATNGKWERMSGLAAADEQPGGGIFAVYVDGTLAFIRKNRTGKWVEIDM